MVQTNKQVIKIIVFRWITSEILSGIIKMPKSFSFSGVGGASANDRHSDDLLLFSRSRSA
jgi:hypothetical protein